MKQSRGKTEIRMFSNGRARILGNGSNDKMHNFWVKVFSDFYEDYKESLRLKYPSKKYFSKYEKVGDRLNITEAGDQKLNRADQKAQTISRRMERLVERNLILLKNLQVFNAAGSPQKSLTAIISYVRSVYHTIYDIVKAEGITDPHPVALAAAKVACNFIITIKTAIIMSSLGDQAASAALNEAGLNQIEEGGPVEGEENLTPDLSKQLRSLVTKYKAAYQRLGITSIMPPVTQQIRRIALATLATQNPQLNIPETVYALGTFAYNKIIGNLVEHILQEEIAEYENRMRGNQSAEGQIEQVLQQETVAQSKRPRTSALMNEPQEDYLADDLDEEDEIFEGVEDKDFEEDDEEADVMALSPVKDEEEYDETDSEFIDPQYIGDDDYDDDDEEEDYDDDDEEEDYDDDDEEEEVSETKLEQAIADIQVSPQSKRLAQKFAAQNPEGFEDYDELKRKLYSFLIKNLFRYRYFSDEKAEDEAKEHIADIIDRLESIEEKIGSLEEAVGKVVEASTAVVENTEDSEEEDEKFDLFLEKSKKEEKEEEESDSQEEGEEDVDSEEEENEEDEEKDKEEEEKSQSKRSNRYSEIKKQKKYKDISEKKGVGKKLFSYEEMDEMEEMESKRAKRYSGDTIEARRKKEEDSVKKFRRIFSDEEDREQEKRYEEFFSKKMRQKRLKSKLASDKDAHYGRKSKKHKDVDVVSIIHKLQKPKRRSPRR